MSALELQTVAQIFTERMLNTAAEGMVLAGLVWVLLRLIGRQNSSTRFAIWFSSLLGIVALPIFAGLGFGASHLQVLPSAHLYREITLSGSLAVYLFAGWAAGAGLMLFRLSVGLWRVHQFRNDCSDICLDNLRPAIAEILRDFGSRHRVKLCVSKDVEVPAAIGFFRPAIVFPMRMLPQLSAEEIEAILLHELAHLHRWDHWTNLSQKIVKAVFFFHPAVWWIESRLTLEREMACDDIVLAQTASPRAYASALISFAEKLQNARGLALAQALVSRMHQLSLRVAQILDSERPSRSSLWKPIVGVSASLLVLAFGAAPYVPRFVAFQNSPSQNQSQQLQAQKQEAQSTVTTEAGNVSRALPVAQRLTLPDQPRAIPAAFNPRAGSVPLRAKTTTPVKPVLLRARAKAALKQAPRLDILIVLQTRQDDSSSSGVWTLCIWSVDGGNSAERQLESAIALMI